MTYVYLSALDIQHVEAVKERIEEEGRDSDEDELEVAPWLGTLESITAQASALQLVMAQAHQAWANSRFGRSW